eukprot:14698196-Heterocapsa_arctica.AAC.1
MHAIRVRKAACSSVLHRPERRMLSASGRQRARPSCVATSSATERNKHRVERAAGSGGWPSQLVA